MRSNAGVCTVIDGWRETRWIGESRSTHLPPVNKRIHAAAAVVVTGHDVVSVNITGWDGSGDEVAAATSAAHRLIGRL